MHRHPIARLAVACVLFMPPLAQAACGASEGWIDSACRRVSHVSDDGAWDAYFTGYGWHFSGYGGAARRAELNARSWGGGVGKHITDARGNEEIVFGMAFLDSHSHVQPIAGYARQWYTREVAGMALGGGYFAGATARADILHYVPIPIVLPVGSLRFGKKASLMATLIPRIPGLNDGHVAFFWGRYSF